MALTVVCTETCTVPFNGKSRYVERDSSITFPDIDKFDVKAYSFLKHFDPVDIFSDEEEEVSDPFEGFDDEEDFGVDSGVK